MDPQVSIRSGNDELRAVPTREGALRFVVRRGGEELEFLLPAERLKELQSVLAQAVINDPRLGAERARSL